VPQDPWSARGPARPRNRLDGPIEGGPALDLSSEGRCENLRSEAHAEKRAILPDPPPDAIHLIAVDLIFVIFECGPGICPDSPPDNYPYWPF